MGLKIAKNHLERMFTDSFLKSSRENDIEYYRCKLKSIAYKLEENFSDSCYRGYAIKSLAETGYWILQMVKNEPNK